MIAVAIEVYSAVSNYYDKFAKSRVILVDEKLRKKMQKLRDLEQALKKVNDRSNSLDDSFIHNIPKLIPKDDLNEISDHYDYEFSDHNLGTRSKVAPDIGKKLKLSAVEEVKEEHENDMTVDIESSRGGNGME